MKSMISNLLLDVAEKLYDAHIIFNAGVNLMV